MYTHTINLGLDPREVTLDQFLHLETSPLVIISQSENERTSNVKQIAGSYFENQRTQIVNITAFSSVFGFTRMLNSELLMCGWTVGLVVTSWQHLFLGTGGPFHESPGI